MVAGGCGSVQVMSCHPVTAVTGFEKYKEIFLSSCNCCNWLSEEDREFSCHPVTAVTGFEKMKEIFLI